MKAELISTIVGAAACAAAGAAKGASIGIAVGAPSVQSQARFPVRLQAV